MLFELSIAKKYLIPKKKRLTMSLIALMSVGVISLVVWLVLVFLSVTAGIEKGWISKLTALNSPIRISPTPEYYNSYYYRVDEISLSSSYTHKNIGEKNCALVSDPHSLEDDITIPTHWPTKHFEEDGSLKDLVKPAFQAIKESSSDKVPLTAQDYEIGVSQLNLQLTRTANGSSLSDGYASQLCYLSSFSNNNPSLYELIKPPRIEDLNHLLTLASLAPSHPTQKKAKIAATLQDHLASLFFAMTIERIKTSSCQWKQLFTLLPEKVPFNALAKLSEQGSITYIVLPLKKEKKTTKKGKSALISGTLIRTPNGFTFTSKEGQSFPINDPTQLKIAQPLSLAAKRIKTPLEKVSHLSELRFDVITTIQGKELKGSIFWEGLEIEKATAKVEFSSQPQISPPWPYFVLGPNKQKRAFLPKIAGLSQPIILPSSLQKGSLKIGDNGTFVYKTATLSSLQEQFIQTTVVGFYDPGIMGLKPVLTHPDVIRDINLATQAPALIPYPTNGICIWFDDLSQTEAVCTKLRAAFKQAGLLDYWSITPFYRYNFVKDLFEQFKSDKYLLTLIAVLILIVACTNIISLLVILVGEKKREIAILRAMGASKQSIALIFTLCGAAMGLVSTFIGISLAYLTMHNIDSLVNFLSFLQGHEAFNAAFYGKSLPNQLSPYALTFIAIATPLLSLAAGLIPALKACRYCPSEILRS